MSTNTNPNISTFDGVSRKRRRPAVVCNECRRRKIACDRKAPCGQCVQYNSACTYYTPEFSPRPRTQSNTAINTYASSSSSIGLETFRPTEALPLGMFDDSTAPPPSVDDNISSAGTLVNAQRTRPATVHAVALPNPRTAAPHAHASAATAPPAQNPTPTTTPESKQSSEAEQPLVTGRSSRPLLKGRFSKSRLFGQSHWMNSCIQVSYPGRPSFSTWTVSISAIVLYACIVIEGGS